MSIYRITKWLDGSYFLEKFVDDLGRHIGIRRIEEEDEEAFRALGLMPD